MGSWPRLSRDVDRCSRLKDGVLLASVGSWEPKGKAGCSWDQGTAFPWL